MSWTPDADPTPETAVTGAPPESEAPTAETTAVPETEAAPPARRRRAPKKELPAETPPAPEMEAPVVEAQVAPTPEATESPRTRRRGRRQATTPEGTPPAAPAEQEASATETPAETPRRRGRRRTPEAPTPETAAAPTAETPVAETPADEKPGEAPAPRRRGRHRTAVSEPSETPTPPPAPAAADTPAPEAPSRRRGRRKATETQEPVELSGLVEGVPLQEEVPTPEAAFDLASPPSLDVALPPSVPAESGTTAATPSRRRGRRRGSKSGTIPDLEAPVADTSGGSAEPEEDAGETTEEGEARGRKRGRRSRRRRGQDDVILESVDLTETGMTLPELSRDEEAEEEEADFVLPLSAPVYSAPPLVPPVLPLPAGAPVPHVEALLRPDPKGGLSQIVVNDSAHAPYFFFVNTETAEDGKVVDAQIREAAASGLHLYSGVMYLPLRNAYGSRSFGAIDALLQQILAADPDGYLLPRLQFVPTNFWARTHPDQMARYADGSEGDVSLASSEFWADCVDALEALVAHLTDPETPGGDRVIGFHLERGEWFYDAESGPDISVPNREAFQHWLQAQYQALYALRAAWFDGAVTFEDAAIPLPLARDPKKGQGPLYTGPRDGRWVDYARFSSALAAQAITGLASVVKTLSAGRMLVAVSYGYTLEFATRNDSGHLALAQVLASPDIDIVAGPNSYAGREAGGAGAFGAPVDSVALHGKLWLVEDDTKTFLAETETPDTYNPKIAGGADTQAAHERHFGAALAHKAGVTWMDLWGQGWLNSPDIWRGLRGLRDQAALSGRLAAGGQGPDVAVLVDEASLAYIKNDPNGLGLHLIGRTRDLLLRAGASVGFYLQSDVTQANFPDSKLILFLNALRVTTAERQAIREKLQRPGKTLAWLYAPAMFNERGATPPESSEVVGMTLRLQAWNARLGSQTTGVRHPITERLRSSRRVGQDEVMNPSFAVSDPQATVLAEYAANGAPSLAVREHPDGWKSVFFGDPHLTVELLRGLYQYAGVPVYDSQDDITSVGDGVLLVHAPSQGQRTFWLPQRATVYDAAEHKIVGVDTRSFRAFLKTHTTRLFLWGERSAVAAATGLPLPSADPVSLPEPPPLSDALPPPPDIPSPIAAPLSESAAEIAARYEREQFETDAGSQEAPPPTLQVSDLAAVLLMPEEEGSEEAPEEEADTTAEASDARPRSRWQRRRAAARARRDAEREARVAEGAPGTGSAANAPLDISALLPDLPPRLKAPEPTAEAQTQSEEDGELPS